MNSTTRAALTLRCYAISVALAVLALTVGCGGGATGERTIGTVAQRTSGTAAQRSIFTVPVEGIGLVLAPSRPAREPSSCTAHERKTEVAITFAAANAKGICKEWIRRQSGEDQSWSIVSSSLKGKLKCIFLVQPVGLVEVDDPGNGSAGNRLCAAFAKLPTWIRFTAAETAKRRGRPIPVVLDVPSVSMEPTLHCARPMVGCEAAASDLLVIDLVPPSALKRGDIVAFNAPQRASKCGGAGARWEKRLIGLPGERWEERSGYFFINGKKLDEPYVHSGHRDSQSIPEKAIAKDEYLVLGDNRIESCDSRLWGPLPVQNILGRVSDVMRSR